LAAPAGKNRITNLGINYQKRKSNDAFSEYLLPARNFFAAWGNRE
jgi:hypothetical protein